jgi:hypothetical protein
MPDNTLRQDQASVSFTVDGRPMPFIFQKRSGGEIGGEGSKTAPGNMLPKVAHGGIQDIADSTYEFEFKPNRDKEAAEWLKSRAMKGRFSAVENMLDVDGSVIDVINRWTGIVSKVHLGDYDATSSDPRVGIIETENDGPAA